MGEIFERSSPAEPDAQASPPGLDDLHRYFLARELCRGRDVLHVSSGDGAGTALLAQTARSVTGVELSPRAVLQAEAGYVRPNLRFLQGDPRALPLANAAADAVVAFGTLERFIEHDAFLTDVKRVLRPGGVLIVSAMQRDAAAQGSPDPFHATELSGPEFDRLLARHFPHVVLLAQRTLLGSAMLVEDGVDTAPLTFERRGSARFEATSGLPRAGCRIAVASGAPLSSVPPSVFVDQGDVPAVQARAAQLADALERLQAAGQQLEAAGARSAAVQRRLDDQAEAAGQELAALREQSEALQHELDQRVGDADALAAAEAALAKAQAATATACTQRDSARLALSRARLFAEANWKSRAAAAEQALADMQPRLDALHDRLARAEADTAEWRRRYDGLRAKLETVLRRSLVLPMSRLIPRGIRRWARERLLGGSIP